MHLYRLLRAGEDKPIAFQPFTPTQNRLTSLPASQGGLGIPQLKERASEPASSFYFGFLETHQCSQGKYQRSGYLS